MRTNKKTIKNILCCATGFAMLATANVGLYHAINNKNISVSAVSSTGTSTIPVTITNSNFNSNTQYSMPFAPNGYTTKVNSKTVTDMKDITSVKAGVIKLSHTDYTNKFLNAKRTGLLDEYVLMIDTLGNYAEVNYTTSSAVSMSANSSYMLTVDVYTDTNASIANLYLYDADGKVFSSMEKINSYANWSTYTFLVSTNEQSLSLKLGMEVKGNGIALFDNISCFQINDKYLNNKITNLDKDFYEYNDTVTEVIKNYTIANNAFVVNSNGSIVESHQVKGLNASAIDSIYTDLAETDGTNSGALKLSVAKENKTYSAWETDDSLLTFDDNSVYLVTITAKTENLSGKATLKLVQTGLEEGETGTDSTEISITSNTGSSSNVTNNYSTYSFYVRSHNANTTTYKLQLALGDSSTSTSGDLYISNVSVSNISYSTYSAASTGSNAQKIDLATADDKDYALANGHFNNIQVDDYTTRFPATPASWTETKGVGAQYYGVINTEDSNFATLSSIGVTVNPSEGKNNNVLLMCNEQKDTLSYTSETQNLTSNTYHRFDVDVQTFNSELKVALVTTKNDTEVELASKTVSTDVQDWKTVSLFLHTGFENLDVALKVTMNTKSAGYAFIDNAFTNYPAQPTEALFTTKLTTASDYETAVDLQDMSSNIDLFSINGEATTIKIVDLTTEDLDHYVPSNYTGRFSSIDATKIIAIRSMQDTNVTLTSKLSFSLSADKYYKVSVDVYTNDIGSNNAELSAEELGATIALSDLENATFSKVTSKDNWSTYTFYINSSAAKTSYLSISLGNEEAQCKGDLYVGNISFVESTEEDFNNAKETSKVKLINVTEPKEETENTEPTEDSTNFNWLYLIPSIAFPLAIIICIVGVALRKIKWKKRTKKSKNTYDRNSTVSKQVLSRKATVIKENRLHELNKDLETALAERTKFEEEYKHDLSKLREMKLKRANAVDIAKLEKEMKKNQKLTANIGVTVNKIKSEIDYVNTDAYFNALMKKIEREPVAEKTDSEETK